MTYNPNRTGYVYDPIMTLHKSSDHPECPERIQEIYKALLNRNLLSQMIAVKSRLATRTELRMAHSEQYLDNLEHYLDGSRSGLKKITNQYNSIYVNSHTLECAKIAAGSTMELVTQVVLGNLDNGVAIVRPPGHHASTHQASGFCIFNNVAISAKILSSKGYKVLIVDYDIHLSDGSTEIVSGDSNILLFSVHRSDDGNFYPYTQNEPQTSNIIYANLNGEITNQTYLDAFNQYLLPATTMFKPDIILVSAGFDAIHGDPLGQSHLTTEGYQQMTRILKKICPKIVMVLEGGYHLQNMSQAFADCVQVLLTKN